jgi:anthranilate 1,2-dioxygenase small subunit
MRDYEALLQIDTLQMNYVAALDRRDMNGWINCFAGNGSYICTTRENDSEDLPVALMMDDCRERLQDRVKFIMEVWSGTFEDYLTRHFVQRLAYSEDREGSYAVTSNFMVTYTTAAGRSEVLVSGHYLDCIERNGSGVLFRSKKAVLDTTITPRYLVYPV